MMVVINSSSRALCILIDTMHTRRFDPTPMTQQQQRDVQLHKAMQQERARLQQRKRSNSTAQAPTATSPQHAQTAAPDQEPPAKRARTAEPATPKFPFTLFTRPPRAAAAAADAQCATVGKRPLEAGAAAAARPVQSASVSRRLVVAVSAARAFALDPEMTISNRANKDILRFLGEFLVGLQLQRNMWTWRVLLLRVWGEGSLLGVTSSHAEGSMGSGRHDGTFGTLNLSCTLGLLFVCGDGGQSTVCTCRYMLVHIDTAFLVEADKISCGVQRREPRRRCAV